MSGLGRGARRAGGSFLPTAAKVAGVAAVGGLAYAGYQHFKGAQSGAVGPFAGASPGAQALGPAASAIPAASQGSANPWAQSSSAAAAPAWGAAAGPAKGATGWGGEPQQTAGWGGGQQPSPAAPVDEDGRALLLVRAMVAAANIDGHIDQQERQNIVAGLAKAGLGAAEQQALEAELRSPLPPCVLLGQVTSPALAKQFYAVTLLAIDRDSHAEQVYTAALPLIVGLSPADVSAVHQQLGS